MRIERVRIQGYRSLRDLEFRPSQFTVLVGANNSGKSNIVDALDFLSTVYRYSPASAIDRKAGFANIAYRDATEIERKISFEVELVASLEELDPFRIRLQRRSSRPRRGDLSSSRVVITHSFTLIGEGEILSDFSILTERIEVDLLGEERKNILKLERNRLDVVVHKVEGDEESLGLINPSFHEEPEFLKRMIADDLDSRSLVIAEVRYFFYGISNFLSYLSRFKVYQLSPHECRAPASPSPVAELGVHGESLPAQVYYLVNSQGESWEKILQSMAQIVPDLTTIEVRFSDYDRLWILQFVEESGKRWNANEVSDGTIRMLGLLTSVYDPRSALIAIEEPENSVHPWILRNFVEICRGFALDGDPKQILLTTHSPILINQLNPDEIVVVWKQDGATQLRRLVELDPSAMEDWSEGLASLFDLLDSGVIRELIPVRS